MKLSVLAASIALIAKTVSTAPVNSDNDIVVTTENGDKAYFWPIEKRELNDIREIFDDEKREIDLKGTWVTIPQRNCHNCGKREDFLDSVYTADRDGVHSKEFMKRALLADKRENKAPDRFVRCANCDTQSLSKRGWASNFNWKSATCTG